MGLRTQKLQSLVQELSSEGLAEPGLVQALLTEHQKLGTDLGDLVVNHGVISEQELNERLAKKAGVPLASAAELKPEQSLIKLLNPSQASRWQIFPIQQQGNKLTVATSDPFDFTALDEIRSELGKDVSFTMASKHDIEKLIDTYYRKQTSIPVQTQDDPTDLNAVSLLDEILENAIKENASDIHIEPSSEFLGIRFRIDGSLENRRNLPISLHSSILSRIKIMGGMDVAEHRIPQDGRLRKKFGGKNLDVRISTYPTILGEAAAIRLLSKENMFGLKDLGLDPITLKSFEQLIQKPFGIFLVTGPTGSGKTTTLYTALSNIDRAKNHVLTVEDPVEQEIELTSQTQVNIKAGLSFANVLRSMLRQDPDVIMVGEIRDQETAEIACRAAMTGHLVFSTLHTNTAIGAIARLQDLGVPTFLISSTIIGLMAQRLVRKLCPHCRVETSIPQEYLTKLGPLAGQVKNHQSSGCNACKNRGYLGRIGIYELIPFSDEIRVLVNSGAPEVRIKERARISGYKTILEDGLQKVSSGLTSLDEVLRVCGETL